MVETKKESGLTAEQRSWRRRIIISTCIACAGYYLWRKVLTICKTTLAVAAQVNGMRKRNCTN